MDGSATRGAGSGALLVAVLAATGIGLLGSNTMPILVGALIDGLGMDEGGVGLFASLELGGVALGSLGVAALAARISRRRAGLLGGAIAALGYAAAAAAPSAAPLAAARFVAGLGCGVAMAAGNAAAAAVDEPDRLFARVAFFGGGVAAVMLGLLPLAVGAWGFRGAYLCLAGVCVVALPLQALLPATAPARVGRRAPGLPAPAIGATALVAVGLFWLSDQALWTFTERIGIRVGLTRQEIGGVLAASTLVGLLGAAAAALLGTLRGRTLPLVLGLAGSLAVRVALANAATPLQYTALQLCWGTIFLFTLPYVAGTTAALDRQGRFAAAAGGVGMAGTAIGPGVAGLLMVSAGPAALGWFLLVASALSLALLTPVSRWLDRRTEDPSEAEGGFGRG